MWGVALFAYVIAVLQRTSLGVAGVQAADRFDISASVLSSLVVLQIIVYAGLQIPVGVLLDRVGPKFLIASGAVLMMAGRSPSPWRRRSESRSPAVSWSAPATR